MRKSKTVIIMDIMNGLVWVKDQRSAGGMASVKFYGKDARRFTSVVKLRKYASVLAKRKKGVIFNKDIGRYLK